MKHVGLLCAAAATAVVGMSSPSFAQANDPYLGQVMLVGFGFCPVNWIDANGQLLPINQFSALFALLGTTYGGNGTTTFAVPDLQGRVPMGQGNGAGLPPAVQGQQLGTATTALNVAQMPAHSHTLTASSALENATSPAGAFLPTYQPSHKFYTTTGPASVAMGPGSVSTTGQGLPFDQHQPSLVMRYCIATAGVFPSRP